MRPGYDEQVPGVDGTEVHEGHDPLVGVHDAGLGATFDDLAEHAVLGHPGRLATPDAPGQRRTAARRAGSVPYRPPDAPGQRPVARQTRRVGNWGTGP